MKQQIIWLVVLSAIAGSVFGAMISFAILNSENSENALIKEFYLTENAVHVSPHSLRLKMDKGDTDFILVDVRSQEEYEKEHVVGAINIPAYASPNLSIKLGADKKETERIIKQFSALPRNKAIIVYCYSMPCMTGRKIGKLLAENKIYVKQLGIGWNEWRYFWTLWNHDPEWTTTNVYDYVVSGKAPGTPKLKHNQNSCSAGEYSC